MEAFRQGLLAAGFDSVEIVDSGADLNAYKEGPGAGGCCAPTSAAQPEPQSAGGCGCGSGADAGGCGEPEAAYHARMAELLAAFDFNEYAASVKVFALKPQA
jgi:hypothetical protein